MAKEKKDALNQTEDSEKKTKKAKGSKKNAKKDNGKKGNGVVRWFRDLRIEFKNVTWPTRKTVTINTSVVLVTVAVASIVVGLLDTGMLKLMEFLIGLSQS